MAAQHVGLHTSCSTGQGHRSSTHTITVPLFCLSKIWQWFKKVSWPFFFFGWGERGKIRPIKVLVFSHSRTIFSLGPTCPFILHHTLAPVTLLA